ncbi:hypothetical protein FQA39_LY01382 [Lamprigera yunnana]|nr:hypothetical protein FQA39_LY01382 [Lamprigera yunnana]
MAERELENFLVNIVVTSFTSIVVKTLTAPIERIKLILQNQDSQVHIIKGKIERYNGFKHCLFRIPKEQGYLSFWRGNGANLLRYIPGQALNFAFNDMFKRHLFNSGFESKYDVLLGFVSGACAGAVSILMVYPLKYCQTRLSVDMGSQKLLSNDQIPREFCGFTDCAAKVLRQNGIFGTYKGFSVAFIGSTMHRALYFGLFDAMNHCYKSYHNVSKVPLGINFFMAQIVTNISGLATYPFDTISRRLMVECSQPQHLRTLNRPWNATQVLYATEGFRSFYKGVATLWRGNVMNITRYFPMQAFNFAFNGEFNNLFQSVIGTDTDRKAFFVKFLSGAVAGVCTHSIFFPLEMCNTRIALDMGGGKKSKLEREFYGMADCLKKIKGKDGIGGLYIGYPVSCVGTALYRGLYFALYDFVKNMWDQKKPESYYHTKKPPVYIQLALAQAASTGASLSIYPMDTISRRLMLDAGRPKELRLFTSPLQAIKVLYKLGGIPAFYKGGLVNCFRSFSGALILVFYDEIVYRAQLNKFITGCDNC